MMMQFHIIENLVMVKGLLQNQNNFKDYYWDIIL